MMEELGKQGIVLYRGSQKDVKPWIKRAHGIIHPSTYGEGMSNVLLENASSGRLIITTDNPGCKETVDDKVSGFTDTTYSAVTGLAYDNTNKELGVKVGADTVIPFSGSGSANGTLTIKGTLTGVGVADANMTETATATTSTAEE